MTMQSGTFAMIFLLIMSSLLYNESFSQGTISESTIAWKDNSIFSESNNSNGAGPFLFAGRTGLGNTRRGLLKFPTVNIPAAFIKAVTVRIHVNQVSNTTARTLRLHRLTSDWGEGTSSSNSGTGAIPSTGDATWNSRFYNTQSWTDPGGDFEQIATASVPVSDVGYYTFAGAGLLADYKAWVNNPSSNFGWIVIGDEAVNNSVKRISTKENGVTNAPQITVVYELPEKLILYPTITTGLLKIRWKHQLKDFSIFSMSGQEVSGGSLSGQQLNLHFLPAGAYLMRIKAVSGQSASGSFIKK